jgi:hypothetical protein
MSKQQGTILIKLYQIYCLSTQDFIPTAIAFGPWAMKMLAMSFMYKN